MSQNERIAAHLQAGKSLTALSALHKFGAFRCAARIAELKDQGFRIRSQMIRTREGKRIARYSL